MPGTLWPAALLDCGQHRRRRRQACHNRAVTAVLIPRANLARLAAGLVALALALGALAVAQGPGRFTTYAGRSGLTASLTVVAGVGPAQRSRGLKRSAARAFNSASSR